MAAPGRPARLSRNQIVAAAQVVVEADGIAALSMRRVAREVGCSPMALYRHVDGFDGMLSLLLDRIAHTLPRPRPHDDPRRWATRVLTITHDWLVAHPWAIDVLPAHRMGWQVAWIVEDLLRAFVAASLSETGAARAYEVVWHHLVGELTTAHSRQAVRATSTTMTLEQAASHPTIATLGPQIALARDHDQYLHGLSALLDGLLPAR